MSDLNITVWITQDKKKNYILTPFKDQIKEWNEFFDKNMGKVGQATIGNLSVEISAHRNIKQVTIDKEGKQNTYWERKDN